MIHKETDISIILPVLNGEKFIEKSILSVLNQTFSNFELIIVDNGSTDSTLSIIQDFLKIEPRITLLNCLQKGVTFALRYGIDYSQGNLIARIDCDDLWHPQKLEIQTEFFNRNQNLALLGTSIEVIDENDNILSNVNFFNKGIPYNWREIKYSLSKNNLFCHSSIMFRKDIYYSLGGYSLRYKYSQDYDLWFKFSKKKPVIIISNKLVYFRVHHQSISSKNYFDQQISTFKIKIRNCFLIGNFLKNSLLVIKHGVKIIILFFGNINKDN